MDEIFSLLNKIKQNPNMYLGRPSLELLFAFITGCICFHNEREHIFMEFLPGFQNFIEAKYNIKKDYGWSSIIQEISNNDMEAFYMFFELLNEYLNQ